MIEIKNISKSYKKGKKVIDNINLKIKDGEIFGFLGPNGAGKTTTIKMITGILEIDNGDILIDGASIKNSPINAKKKIGFVPDNPDMFLKLKGIEYLNFIADVYEVSSEQRIEKIKELSEMFEMEGNLNNKIQSYSHGMRQKIIIMGVLLHEPQNLILDEPMTGLDPKSSFDLKNIMKDYAKKNKTVFFSTHILEVAEKLCDRIAVIDKGRILFIGTYEEMKKQFNNNGSLEDVFMEITEND
ncbi:MAG: ABC transporter ATP-binding protein [Clostridia bacterium]|nr:ABC transporter ATP-binding protein [Clostridia bacterium]